MDNQLVSVIMPTYNGSKHLAASIESVLNQSYSNLELLITDDCSSDPETIRIINDFAKRDARVRPFFFKENKGPGCSRNCSIERARGRYIAFCDSDDRWFPHKLEKQLRFMQQRDCCLVFSSYMECDENDRECGMVVAPELITLTDLKHDNKIGCLTAIYDTSKHGKFFMPTIRKRQDWALFLTIMKQCKVAYGITQPLAYYRLTKHSVSRNKFALIKYNARVYQTVFGYSPLLAYGYMCGIFLPTYTLKVVSNKLKYYAHIRRRK